MVKIKTGDIIEVPTANGLAYAQFTHKHAEYGYLMRCVEGIWQERPLELVEVVEKPNRFVFFFALREVLKQGLLEKVGNEKVPNGYQDFPLFRTGLVMPDGKVAKWWLWDGNKSWIVGNLTEEQKSLPVRGVWNVKLLVDRIESDYRPESEI